MSNIGKQALRDIAESIEREEWEVLDNGDDEYQVIVKGSLEKGETYRSYQPVSNEISERKIAAFIAAFSPATALALLDDLEAAEHTAAVDHEAACSLVEENEEVKRKLAAAEKRIAELRDWNLGLAQESFERQQRIAETSCQKRLIGWRASDYTDETSDPELAKNWAAAIGVLPIFEGDVNTKLSAAGIGKGE
ncbi:ead/Ea22-like family protein [Citrobacter sp. RHB20-C16]|uniref:ead/Ea22-like family protein n=1 Tax=unclassified Citrobacter TaxID=2644389 RepID=UPI0015EAF0F5|nr:MULTISPECIES: ead/Ea22-like family protein [unclassified Citrobacter]QMK77582.1 ead/Ea22-like family protein [Citrobacter sp. RHB20-C16]QMK82195.1 ead/Ea22-like family protein [Citrobacter sp. RHB20-C15]